MTRVLQAPAASAAVATASPWLDDSTAVGFSGAGFLM
jgi:hypothetical protein